MNKSRLRVKPAHAPIQALDALAATLGGSVIATVITAVAAGIALVAATLALYDVVTALISPAAAAALVAFVLTLVAVISATIGQWAVRAKAASLDARLAASKPPRGPQVYRLAGEIGLAVLGFAAERAVRHRAQHSKRNR